MESRYKIITNSKLPSLEKQVNDAIVQGWDVFGWPFQDNSGNYVQALTKDNTSKSNTIKNKESSRP